MAEMKAFRAQWATQVGLLRWPARYLPFPPVHSGIAGARCISPNAELQGQEADTPSVASVVKAIHCYRAPTLPMHEGRGKLDIRKWVFIVRRRAKTQFESVPLFQGMYGFRQHGGRRRTDGLGPPYRG